MSAAPPDPPDLARFANLYGFMVARGTLEWEEAAASVAGALWAHRPPQWTNESGFRAVCAWRVRDAAFRWEMARDKADKAIRKALSGLLYGLAEPDAIVRRAFEVNESFCPDWPHTGPLHAYEVRAVINEEVAWWMRQNAPAVGRRRRVG